MKRMIVLVMMAALMAGAADAQTVPRVPRVSPGAAVKQIVGLSEVSVSYHRPGVKGRVIWGNVVKYGEAWRAGANEPTLVTISDEAVVGGAKLAAGSYRLVVIPAAQGEWTVVFNSDVKNWGSIYDAKFDVLKVPVKPETGPHVEWMTFSFEDPGAATVNLVLAWEKVRLVVPLEFNTLAKVQGSLGTWQLLASAARFAADNGVYLTEAMSWADRSIALERNPRNLQVKAELLAKAGKTQEAIALAEEAVKLTKAKDPAANTAALDALLSGWKSRK